MGAISLTERFFASTRGRIVTRLRRGDATVEELAAHLGVTDNAVRAQLAALERDGLVRHEGVRRGLGKPSHLYRLGPEVEPMLSRVYGPMLVNLLDELASRYPAAELDSIMHAVGRRLSALMPTLQGDLATRVAAASGILNAGGAATEVEATEASYVIRGLSCPLSLASKEHAEVCDAVQALLETLLGTEVVERCDRTGSPRCCFEVMPPATGEAPAKG
jgi:predicted ArsR family transcriptional regulator